MLLDLADRVVLITGAARGIGRVIAETFLRERSVVIGLDLEIESLEWLTRLGARGRIRLRRARRRPDRCSDR